MSNIGEKQPSSSEADLNLEFCNTVDLFCDLKGLLEACSTEAKSSHEFVKKIKKINSPLESVSLKKEKSHYDIDSKENHLVPVYEIDSIKNEENTLKTCSKKSFTYPKDHFLCSFSAEDQVKPESNVFKILNHQVKITKSNFIDTDFFFKPKAIKATERSGIYTSKEYSHTKEKMGGRGFLAQSSDVRKTTRHEEKSCTRGSCSKHNNLQAKNYITIKQSYNAPVNELESILALCPDDRCNRGYESLKKLFASQYGSSRHCMSSICAKQSKSLENLLNSKINSNLNVCNLNDNECGLNPILKSQPYCNECSLTLPHQAPCRSTNQSCCNECGLTLPHQAPCRSTNVCMDRVSFPSSNMKDQGTMFFGCCSKMTSTDSAPCLIETQGNRSNLSLVSKYNGGPTTTNIRNQSLVSPCCSEQQNLVCKVPTPAKIRNLSIVSPCCSEQQVTNVCGSRQLDLDPCQSDQLSFPTRETCCVIPREASCCDQQIIDDCGNEQTVFLSPRTRRTIDSQQEPTYKYLNDEMERKPQVRKNTTSVCKIKKRSFPYTANVRLSRSSNTKENKIKPGLAQHKTSKSAYMNNIASNSSYYIINKHNEWTVPYSPKFSSAKRWQGKPAVDNIITISSTEDLNKQYGCRNRMGSPFKADYSPLLKSNDFNVTTGNKFKDSPVQNGYSNIQIQVDLGESNGKNFNSFNSQKCKSKEPEKCFTLCGEKFKDLTKDKFNLINNKENTDTYNLSRFNGTVSSNQCKGNNIKLENKGEITKIFVDKQINSKIRKTSNNVAKLIKRNVKIINKNNFTGENEQKSSFADILSNNFHSNDYLKSIERNAKACEIKVSKATSNHSEYLKYNPSFKEISTSTCSLNTDHEIDQLSRITSISYPQTTNSEQTLCETIQPLVFERKTYRKCFACGTGTVDFDDNLIVNKSRNNIKKNRFSKKIHQNSKGNGEKTINESNVDQWISKSKNFYVFMSQEFPEKSLSFFENSNQNSHIFCNTNNEIMINSYLTFLNSFCKHQCCEQIFAKWLLYIHSLDFVINNNKSSYSNKFCDMFSQNLKFQLNKNKEMYWVENNYLDLMYPLEEESFTECAEENMMIKNTNSPTTSFGTSTQIKRSIGGKMNLVSEAIKKSDQRMTSCMKFDNEKGINSQLSAKEIDRDNFKSKTETVLYECAESDQPCSNINVGSYNFRSESSNTLQESKEKEKNSLNHKMKNSGVYCCQKEFKISNNVPSAKLNKFEPHPGISWVDAYSNVPLDGNSNIPCDKILNKNIITKLKESPPSINTINKNTEPRENDILNQVWPRTDQPGIYYPDIISLGNIIPPDPRNTWLGKVVSRNSLHTPCLSVEPPVNVSYKNAFENKGTALIFSVKTICEFRSAIQEFSLIIEYQLRLMIMTLDIIDISSCSSKNQNMKSRITIWGSHKNHSKEIYTQVFCTKKSTDKEKKGGNPNKKIPNTKTAPSPKTNEYTESNNKSRWETQRRTLQFVEKQLSNMRSIVKIDLLKQIRNRIASSDLIEKSELSKIIQCIDVELPKLETLKNQIDELLKELQVKIGVEDELEGIQKQLKEEFVTGTANEYLKESQAEYLTKIRYNTLMEMKMKLNKKLNEVNEMIQQQIQEQILLERSISKTEGLRDQKIDHIDKIVRGDSNSILNIAELCGIEEVQKSNSKETSNNSSYGNQSSNNIN